MCDQDVFDVAVVGAGPAGATAAVLLAKRGFRVVLVGVEGNSGEAMGWQNALTAPLLDKLGVPVSPLLDRVVRDVSFFSGDLEKKAAPAFETPPAHIVDRGALIGALTHAAESAGVALMLDHQVVDVKLGEHSVELMLSDEQAVASRLMLFAAGRDSKLVDRLGIPQERSVSPIWNVHVEGEVPAAAGGKEPRLAIVLGLDKVGSFGVCCVTEDRASVAIHWRGEREDALPAFLDLCRRTHEKGIVPIDLTATAAGVRPWGSPAGVALDMDSHVGKHALLIGDAGGFVAALSDEGIYPAMWSAQMAVDILAEALGSKHSQDELMAFNSQWRIQMADYLRSPHTDIQFLLPLIFSNQPMADRMGAAFFAGENI